MKMIVCASDAMDHMDHVADTDGIEHLTLCDVQRTAAGRRVTSSLLIVLLMSPK